jgi:bacteriorhodopsin
MTYNLTSADPVGMSFWLISMALVAATAFFFIERDRVDGKWKTSLTVPLLMVEFYLVLSAVTKVPVRIFWKLLLGSIAMLGFGFAGETGMMDVNIAFVLGIAGWAFIVWEIFKGEASQINAGLSNANVQKAYKWMLICVTIGWSIYPIGYFFGYMAGGADAAMLNIVYNLADFINKIAFGVIIWAAAVADSDSKA